MMAPGCSSNDIDWVTTKGAAFYFWGVSLGEVCWGAVRLWCFCSRESARLGRKQPSTKESVIKTSPGGIATALPALPAIAKNTIWSQVLRGHSSNARRKSRTPVSHFWREMRKGFKRFVWRKFPTDQLKKKNRNSLLPFCLVRLAVATDRS